MATGASGDKALLEQQALGSNAWGTSKSSFPLSATQQHLRLRRVAVEFGAALTSIVFGALQLGDEGA
jgi:hypothetical protein